MAFYLVRASPKTEKQKLDELRTHLDRGEFEDMRPFGNALTQSLENARYDESEGEAVWEEEDYCSPPLAQEREAVLDDYFDGIEVEKVEKGEGWEMIEGLPSLWKKLEE
ncbi:MAG: hypothetical protein SXQ77_09255 [Halobacteria archaeon]|nr:hypothetical protein [Halobacteria archaeon]